MGLLRLLLLLPLSIGACGGACGPRFPSPPEPSAACLSDAPPAGGEEAVIVGRGQGASFTPLMEGEELLLERGAQGGQHFFLTLRLFAKADRVWFHDARFLDARREELGYSGSNQRACAGEWTEITTFPVFVHAYTSTTMRGLLELHSSAIDERGEPKRTVSAQLELVARSP